MRRHTYPVNFEIEVGPAERSKYAAPLPTGVRLLEGRILVNGRRTGLAVGATVSEESLLLDEPRIHAEIVQSVSAVLAQRLGRLA